VLEMALDVPDNAKAAAIVTIDFRKLAFMFSPWVDGEAGGLICCSVCVVHL
jgi:hypothetical protein